jgi:hypothetical protein
VSKTTPEKTSKKQAEHDHLGIHFGLLFVGNLDTNLVNLDDNLVNLERVSRLTKLPPKLTKFVSKLAPKMEQNGHKLEQNGLKMEHKADQIQCAKQSKQSKLSKAK